MIASHLGPDLVLRSEFDGIRDFITGRDVQPVLPVTSPDGEEGWTMDVRYVSNWLADRTPAPWLTPSAHAIVIDLNDRALRGRVYLWGERVFTVTAARLEDAQELVDNLPVMLVARETGEGVVSGAMAVV